MSQSIEVAAAIIFHQGKILISQRMKHEHLADYWEFPGGKVREDESLEECVVRELQEELTVQVKVKEKVWETSYSYPEKRIELNFFSCDWIGGEVKAIECQKAKWVEPKELTQYQFPPANEELIKGLVEGKFI